VRASSAGYGNGEAGTLFDDPAHPTMDAFLSDLKRAARWLAENEGS
jgi:hypothetical protein